MTVLEEHEKHVVNTRATNKLKKPGISVTHCGEQVSMEWAFTDVDHLVNSNSAEDRLVACPACKERIIEIINTQ